MRSFALSVVLWLLTAVNAADVANYEAQFSEKPGYLAYCNNINGMASMVGCFAAENSNNTETYNFLVQYCSKYYLTTVTIDNLTYAYEYYLDNAVALEDIPDYNISVPLSTPLKVNTTRAKLFHDAYEVFLGNYDDSLYYGAGCVGYWGLIAVISMIFNWGSVLFPNVRNFFNGSMSKLARKYIFLPALMRNKKADSQKFLVVLDFLIPSRVESLVIFVFFWLVFVLNATGIYYVKNDPVFDNRWASIHRYVADRTGIVCTVLIPLLVLLGGRNNFLQFLTRWKYSTVMAYHRWIARMVVLMAVIHSIAFTQILISEGKEYYYEDMAENYLIWGTVATVCGSLICFQGLLVLRRRWYETFLVIHILLAVFFVVGTWYHIWELGYAQIMYPVFVVWFFDRLVRVVRLVAFGFPKATVTLLADETVKVEVRKPKYWHATPGGHAWIYFGVGMYFWQSHPFTFVESPTGLIFFCKVKGGVTKSLYKKLLQLPGKTLSVRVGIEGPYGESHPIKHHSDVVFVAGGNGVPGLYSELKDLVKRNPHGKQNLKFIWIIRELRTLAWFYEQVRDLQHTKVETTIYVTRPEEVRDTEELEGLISVKSDSDGKEKDDAVSNGLLAQIGREFPHVHFIEGRPSLEQIVTTEVGEASNSVAFLTCGHPVMVDDLRYQVVNILEKTRKRVDFYEALEIWA